MKVFSFFMLTGLLTASLAQGQEYRSFPQAALSPQVGYHHASTAQEGWLRGMADRIRAQGEYNYNVAAAALILQQARKSYLDNEMRSAEVFWEKRDLYQSHTAARSVPNSQAEKSARPVAQRAAAKAPSPAVDPSRVDFCWPAALNRPAFDPGREQLCDLFAQRAGAPKNAAIDQRIRSVCAEMRTQLADFVREVSPMDYVEARRFLDQLMRQSGQPAADQVALRN